VTTNERRLIDRPQPPTHAKGPRGWGIEHLDGSYLVMQKGDLVAVYNPVYFRGINEVVADLLDLIAGGLEGPWGDDYVIWCSGRVMAVIHELLDEPGQKVVLFNDSRNDPNEGHPRTPWPSWPSYEEWVAHGRGALWLNERAD
jgi:hypothetical protein